MIGLVLVIFGSIVIGNSVSAGAGWGCFLIGLGILFELPKM